MNYIKHSYTAALIITLIVWSIIYSAESKSDGLSDPMPYIQMLNPECQPPQREYFYVDIPVPAPDPKEQAAQESTVPEPPISILLLVALLAAYAMRRHNTRKNPRK